MQFHQDTAPCQSTQKKYDSETQTDDAAWDAMEQLLDASSFDGGVQDFAHQHDHYIHGTPKREAYP
jgi:hypothetical protein